MGDWMFPMKDYGDVDKQIDEALGLRPTSVSVDYARPKTCGELWDLMLEGIPCEVVTDNVKITSILLRGWLATFPFTVRPSENDGWSVFEIA